MKPGQAPLCALALFAITLGTPSAFGQGTGNGFLFKQPSGMVNLHAGVSRPREGSDLFEFTQDNFTVNRGDFRAIAIGADVSVRIRERFYGRIGVDYSRKTVESEYRNFQDSNNQPIEQATTFSRTPVLFSAKLYLIEPGHSVGTRAWIPAAVAPYVGGGGGVTIYKFIQKGDFIDTNTMNVFTDSFRSTGVAPLGAVFAGADINVHPRAAITFEGRYDWAKAKLDRDFAGFAPIDLAGFSVTSGISIRF